MARSYSAASQTIVVTTAQTIIFQDAQLPQGGISNFFIETTGANNSLDSAIIGVRVKLEGVPIIDLSGVQLRALQEAFFPSSTPPAAAQLRFTVPLAIPYPMTNLWGYSSLIGGIPFGFKTSVEVILSASSSAGTALIGWETLPGDPSYMFKALQQQTSIGASTTNGRVNLNYGENDIIGFLWPNPANEFTRLRYVSMLSNGTELQVDHGDNALTVEYQRRTSPLTITNPLAIKFDRAYKFPAGSYVETDSGSGAGVADVFAALQVVNVMKKTA